MCTEGMAVNLEIEETEIRGYIFLFDMVTFLTTPVELHGKAALGESIWECQTEAPQLCFNLEQNPFNSLGWSRYIRMSKQSLLSHVYTAAPMLP